MASQQSNQDQRSEHNAPHATESQTSSGQAQGAQGQAGQGHSAGANGTHGQAAAAVDHPMTGAVGDWGDAQPGSDSVMVGGGGAVYEPQRVADLSFEEKQKVLKAFWQTGWSNCKEGDYIDATDSVSKWCLAQVVARDDTSVSCHFDGWSSKWDLTYRWTSYKITAFRRCSRGYTGQVKTPLRQNRTFEVEQIRAETARVQDLVDRSFRGLSAHELTQYLRGELFVTVDFLLSANSLYSEEDVGEVCTFLKAVISLIVHWLKLAPGLLETCLPNLRREPDLFLVDEDSALLQSAPELMGILQRLFCGCHRALQFYLHFDQNQQEFKEPVTKVFKGADFKQRRTRDQDAVDIDSLRERIAGRSDDLVFGHALNFVNYFAELGGFVALLALLRAGNFRQVEPANDADGDKPQKELMPLELLSELTGAFSNCRALLSESFANKFVEEVQEIVNTRLMGMRNKEIKELDKDGLPGVFQSYRTFLQLAKSDDEIAELVEQIQLSFAARFLKTTFLEKRLKGVSDIRQLIERVEARATLEKQRRKPAELGTQSVRLANYVVGIGGQKVRPTHYLDITRLRDWIIKEQVAETLFGEGAHPEIVKRAAPVLRFLSQHGSMSQEIVDQVWKCQQGKHEETVRVVYGLINDVVEDLPHQLLEVLFSKIAEVPPAQYSEMYLLFLKDFTLRALEAGERTREYRSTRRRTQPENSAGSVPAGEEEIVSYQVQLRNREREIFSNLNQALNQPEAVALTSEDRLYGLPVLWNIVQDSYQNDGELDGRLKSSEILTLALNALCEVLAQPFARSVRMYYLMACLNNLRSGSSLYASICVAVSIVEALESSGSAHDEDRQDLTSRRAVELLEAQVGLVDIILKDIMHYDQQVKEALKQLVRKGKAPPEKVESYVFAGRMGHQATLEKLLELLEFVVLGSDWAVTVKTTNIDHLWRTFVLSPNFTSDQTLFLQFINKKRQPSAKCISELSSTGNKVIPEVYLFTPEEQKHLFTQILCNPTFVDYQKLSPGITKCFHTYFRLINREEGHLDHGRRKVEVGAFEHLIGVDSLWGISFEGDNGKARDDSRELLVDLHLRLAPRYEPAARRQIMQSFIDRSMALLAQAGNDGQAPGAERRALSVIEALAEFLDRYEGKKPVKPELKSVALQHGHFQPWTVAVICKREGRQQQQEAHVQVSQFESLGSVREKCAALFGLELNEFHLRLKQGVVDPDEDDDRYVKEYGMSPQIYLLPNVAYDKQGHPKYLLAQNQDYFDLLFALLAKSSPSLIEPVWELLQKLPVNAKLHQDLCQLQGAKEGWNSLLDSTSTHKLLYSLKIMEGLNDRKQGERTGKGQMADQANGAFGDFEDLAAWKRRFIELGGVRHLLDTLVGLQIAAIDSRLTLRCIESLLATLLDFMHVDQALYGEILEKKEPVVLTCMRYLHLIGLYGLQVERSRGEAVEDIQAKRTQKRLAKQKMRQLQMASLGNQGRRRGAAENEKDSDGEEDESTDQLNQLVHEFGEVCSIVAQLFSFMDRFVFEQDKEALRILEQYPNLQEMVTVLVLQSENHLVRREAGGRVRAMLARCSGEPALRPTMTALLQVLLTKVLPEAHSQERRCTEYFEQLQLALEELKATDLAPLEQDLSQLAQSLADDIQARETREVDTKVEDRVLVGMMTVLRVLLQKFPARKAAVGARLVPHLLHECLFEVPHGSGTGTNAISKPKCKSMASRTGALRLLSVLSRDCLDNLGLVLDYIRDFGRRASWRTNKQSDWEITHLDDEKSSTGYVGLKNLGCICYMISLMQQLFMVPSFRADLLAVDDPNPDGLEPDENMFYQLQTIFTGLLKSEKQYVNPKGFCHAFKDWEGQPTNVLEQMDVDEFLQMFLDRLESAIKGSAQEKTVQSHFGGTFASEMICKGCPHQYERSEPFVSLCVPVKNKRSIQEGLSAFVQGDMLEGDNAYLCAKCDKKVDTLQRTCVKELPRYLIITLKRFEFDFDRMVRVKVNDYWEFPLELDMLPYTQEGLARREQAAKKKQEAAERGEDAPGEAEAEPLKHPRDYYEFKLKGVVVHTGTADSGHYYSFIREHKQQGDDRWYEFNDHTVSDFDITELENECFGGDDGFTGQGMMQMRSQKWRNAYLVIYERKNQQEIHQEEAEAVGAATRPAANSTVADQVESMMDEESKSTVAKAPKLSSPEHPIQQKILLENQKYWQNKFLFGNEYFEFVSEVTHYWDTAHIAPLSVVNKNADAHIVGFQLRSPPDPSALHAAIPRPLDELSDLRAQHADSPQRVADASHEVFKFAASFYLTILQRAAHKALVPKMLDALKAYLNHDRRNGEWLLLELSNWEIIKEMLLQPQGQEMPKLTCGLIYCAMLTIYEKEKGSLANFWPDAILGEKQRRPNAVKAAGGTGMGTLGNFILLLLSHLYDLKAFVLNLPHYFQILARFASLGPEARAFLLRARIVGRCMDFFFDGASPYRGLFGDVSDLAPIITREEPELGLPTMLDKKVRTYFQMVQEKRRKQQLAGAPPKYKYLMELVGTCVRHLRMAPGPASPYQLDGDFEGALAGFVASQEADIFIPEARFLKRFIVEAKRNRSALAVARAHCHYAYQDREQVEELFRTVEAGLNEHDYDGIRPFLCLFELLLETEGEHFTSRRAVWLGRFLETVKSNFGYFKWMEAILEFIFKITSRNAAVREWFYANQAAWHCLLEWVGQHTRAPHPAQGASSGVRLYKGRQNIQLAALQHHNDPNSASRNGLGAAYRLNRMQELLRQQVTDCSEEPDPDKIDLQDFKFIPGDVVTRLDRKHDQAGQWRVLGVLDEMIQMECLEQDRGSKGITKDPIWQKCDTDKLLLFDTYRQLTRTKIWRQLHEQSQAQRAEAARGAAGLGRHDADEDMEDGGRGGRTHHRVGQATGGTSTTNDGHLHMEPDASSAEYDSSDDDHGDGAN